MNASTSPEHSMSDAAVTRGIVRWLAQITILILIQAACLFLAAGHLDWVMGWVYVGVQVLNQAVSGIVLLLTHPELLADRARSEGPRDMDRVLAAIMFLYGPVATLIVAGLDQRFGGSPGLPAALPIGAAVVAALAAGLGTWALASNRHFYGVYRIAAERGHAAVTTGPYRFVRHPGYLGAILFYLATPLLLGSLWALLPAALTTLATAVRTALEDRRLQDQLDGYRAYAQRTRYRLVPGIW